MRDNRRGQSHDSGKNPFLCLIHFTIGMKHIILFFALFGLGLGVSANPGDTLRVRAHDATHMNWYGNFDHRAGFPTGSQTYQKILLRYTMGCPSSGCSEWDYTTRVFVLRPTGQVDTSGNPIKEEIELCRVITPYAGSFASTWKWTYSFDITDYEPLLHDSVDIRLQFQGYQDGFTGTLDFEFVEGTPPHPVTDLIKLYEGSSPYGDAGNSIENFLTEQSVTIPAGAQYAKLMYRPTGHGFGGNEDCAEFCPKYFYVFTDNAQRAQGLIWNETCGNNPLFPQAGTWLYDRANWCPGGPAKDFAFNLTPYLAAGAHTVNINMQPFTNSGNNNCSYNISGHLFTYGAAAFATDAELVEILTPSNNPNYGRFNPVCMDAKVVVRNYGSNPLTSAKLVYSVQGGVEYEANWSGNLAFLETDTFSFPVSDWTNATTSKQFNVRITEANGAADAYTANNVQSAFFAIPPSYPVTFVLEYKTNAAAGDNAWTIKDPTGNVVYSRSNHTANTVYRDTLDFVSGCYVFEFTDESKNGLTFSGFNNDGTGYLRFKRADNNATLKTFNANFGTSVIQYFTVGGVLSVDESEATAPQLDLFPNPATDQLNIRATGITGTVWMQIIDINGKQVRVEQVTLQNGTVTRDISGLANGVYLLRLVNEKGAVKKKFVKE